MPRQPLALRARPCGKGSGAESLQPSCGKVSQSSRFLQAQGVEEQIAPRSTEDKLTVVAGGPLLPEQEAANAEERVNAVVMQLARLLGRQMAREVTKEQRVVSEPDEFNAGKSRPVGILCGDYWPYSPHYMR